MRTQYLSRMVKVMLAALLAAIARVDAQSVETGAQSVLAPPPPQAGTCYARPDSSRRQALRVVELVGFTDTIGEPQRVVAVGLDEHRSPRVLTASQMWRGSGRAEDITVFFDDSGRVVRGSRSPGSFDGALRLLPSDTTEARALVRALLARCRP